MGRGKKRRTPGTSQQKGIEMKTNGSVGNNQETSLDCKKEYGDQFTISTISRYLRIRKRAILATGLLSFLASSAIFSYKSSSTVTPITLDTNKHLQKQTGYGTKYARFLEIGARNLTSKPKAVILSATEYSKFEYPNKIITNYENLSICNY